MNGSYWKGKLLFPDDKLRPFLRPATHQLGGPEERGSPGDVLLHPPDWQQDKAGRGGHREDTGKRTRGSNGKGRHRGEVGVREIWKRGSVRLE